MAVWDFSVLLLCYCEVFPVENLHIHYGSHGSKQILQNSKASQVPNYFQKEIHRHNSISRVVISTTHAIIAAFAIVSDAKE